MNTNEIKALLRRYTAGGFVYFDGPLDALEAKAIQADDAERLQRAQRHARVLQPAAEWAAWLVKRLEQLGEGTIWQSLLAVVERGCRTGSIRSHPEGVSCGGLHPSSLSIPMMS